MSGGCCEGAEIAKPEVGPFRTVLPQIVAAVVKSILLLDLGLALCFSTIVIPALTGNDKEHNPDEIIYITPSQASWLGSISSICQPLGAFCSGLMVGPLGRKRAMFIVNLPHILAWAMLYFSKSLTQIFVATVILGFGTGLMEAPTITYIGEIAQPSIRGILVATSGISASLGFFMVFLLGSVLPWREVALICGCVPIIVMVALCFIPESPYWLLSKNRTGEAMKSLQWLRGWVSSNGVKDEFQAIQRYNEQSLACNDCIRKAIKCTHPLPTMVDKFRDLFRRRTMKPFLITLVLFAFAQFSGYPPMRPFLVLILKAYGMPINPNWATSILGLMALLGNITLVCIIGFLGKRRVFMLSLSGAVVCCIVLSIYGFIHLPHGLVSLAEGTHVEQIGHDHYFPLIVFILFAFLTNLGIWAIPWMMLSEVFPFKSREFAAGINASLEYVTMFISNKTYLDLEVAFSIPGVTLFYGVIGFIGLVLAYYIMPETEKRSLEEIERHFSDPTIKITDIYIRKLPKNPIDPIEQIDAFESDKKNINKSCDNVGYMKDF